MLIWLKRLGILALIGIFAAGIYLTFAERPVGVDIVKVEPAPMLVSIQEEGTTRVRDVYTVSSPIAGHLNRIALDEGERVLANETIIASIHPLDPPFLDERTQLELRSAVAAAESGVALAIVEHDRTKMALQLAQSEYDRASVLTKKKIMPLSQLENIYNALELRKAEVEGAKAAIDLRRAELAAVKARQQQPKDVNTPPDAEDCCIQITAPVSGVVLKVLARSTQPVSPGTQILEIGDPQKLEVVVDLLSSDAARLNPGAVVVLADWGGADSLQGVIRRIEPAAFTKVSSLGFEEQRVNVIIDMDETPPKLGHGYRVLASLVVWKGENILQVPIGALFRSDGKWATFVVANGTAELRPLDLGQFNDQTAQVLAGLEEGEMVVMYPNETLEDGSLVTER